MRIHRAVGLMQRSPNLLVALILHGLLNNTKFRVSELLSINEHGLTGFHIIEGIDYFQCAHAPLIFPVFHSQILTFLPRHIAQKRYLPHSYCLMNKKKMCFKEKITIL